MLFKCGFLILSLLMFVSIAVAMHVNSNPAHPLLHQRQWMWTAYYANVKSLSDLSGLQYLLFTHLSDMYSLMIGGHGLFFPFGWLMIWICFGFIPLQVWSGFAYEPMNGLFCIESLLHCWAWSHWDEKMIHVGIVNWLICFTQLLLVSL